MNGNIPGLDGKNSLSEADTLLVRGRTLISCNSVTQSVRQVAYGLSKLMDHLLCLHHCSTGIMFSCCPCVSASVCASIHSTVGDVVSSISMVWIAGFSPDLLLVHFETWMDLLGFGVKRSKVKVTAWPNMLKVPFCGFVSVISSVCIVRFSPNFGASRDRDGLISFWGR